MKREARTIRMKGVQRELLVAAAAMGVLERHIRDGDLTALKPSELKPSDAAVTRRNLEATFCFDRSPIRAPRKYAIEYSSGVATPRWGLPVVGRQDRRFRCAAPPATLDRP